MALGEGNVIKLLFVLGLASVMTIQICGLPVSEVGPGKTNGSSSGNVPAKNNTNLTGANPTTRNTNSSGNVPLKTNPIGVIPTKTNGTLNESTTAKANSKTTGGTTNATLSGGTAGNTNRTLNGCPPVTNATSGRGTNSTDNELYLGDRHNDVCGRGRKKHEWGKGDEQCKRKHPDKSDMYCASTGYCRGSCKKPTEAIQAKNTTKIAEMGWDRDETFFHLFRS